MHGQLNAWNRIGVGVGAKLGLRRPLDMREGGNTIKPSAAMRNNATRHVMSLSSPLGLCHCHNSHSKRDSAARVSAGFCSIKVVMVWISAVLMARAQ